MGKKIFCPVCGKEVKRGRKYCCYAHSEEAIDEANRQLKDREGPIYEKWLQKLKESIGNL